MPDLLERRARQHRVKEQQDRMFARLQVRQEALRVAMALEDGVATAAGDSRAERVLKTAALVYAWLTGENEAEEQRKL